MIFNVIFGNVSTPPVPPPPVFEKDIYFTDLFVNLTGNQVCVGYKDSNNQEVTFPYYYEGEIENPTYQDLDFTPIIITNYNYVNTYKYLQFPQSVVDGMTYGQIQQD